MCEKNFALQNVELRKQTKSNNDILRIDNSTKNLYRIFGNSVKLE